MKCKQNKKMTIKIMKICKIIILNNNKNLKLRKTHHLPPKKKIRKKNDFFFFIYFNIYIFQEKIIIFYKNLIFKKYSKK